MSNTESDLESKNLYTIEFQQRPTYLYALVSGKNDSLEVTRKYWMEILEECRQSGVEKLLVEEDLERSLSMQEIYEFAAEYSLMGFREILVAFVDRYPSHQQLNRFGELVATNRGSRIRVFDTVTEAKQWLLVN